MFELVDIESYRGESLRRAVDPNQRCYIGQVFPSLMFKQIKLIAEKDEIRLREAL